MAFQNLPPPPPTKNADSALDRWLQLMRDKISAAGAIVWSQITLPTKAANTVLAGPTTGADAQADFRAIVAADLGTGTPDGTRFLRDDLSWQVPAGSGGGSKAYAARH